MLPYFRKLETDLDFAGRAARRLRARRRSAARRPRMWPPLSHAMQQYADERQIPHVADMNADFRDGYGSLPMSNTAERRASAAMCYLDASVRARPNLTHRVPGDRHGALCSRAGASPA